MISHCWWLVQYIILGWITHGDKFRRLLSLVGFVNEGRIRTQESAIRPLVTEVSEGRLRAVEAIERTVPKSAALTVSEGRHRLQEGTKVNDSLMLTPFIQIPNRSAAASSLATSVPNTTTRMKGPAAADVSSSLSRHISTEWRQQPSPLQPTAAQAQNTPKENYDESKNPFADETPVNPFGEEDDDYNDSLNPFAE